MKLKGSDSLSIASSFFAENFGCGSISNQLNTQFFACWLQIKMWGSIVSHAVFYRKKYTEKQSLFSLQTGEGVRQIKITSFGCAAWF